MLTERQRNAILERDGHTSQMKHYSEVLGFYRGGYCIDDSWEECTSLQVHHIQPQRYMYREGATREEVDDPKNLITLFECEHNGTCKFRKLDDDPQQFVVHPDMAHARRLYRELGKEAYQIAFDHREELLEAGEPYWETDHDLELFETASELTDNAVINGWVFPEVNGMKKEHKGHWYDLFFIGGDEHE